MSALSRRAAARRRRGCAARPLGTRAAAAPLDPAAPPPPTLAALQAARAWGVAAATLEAALARAALHATAKGDAPGFTALLKFAQSERLSLMPVIEHPEARLREPTPGVSAALATLLLHAGVEVAPPPPGTRAGRAARPRGAAAADAGRAAGGAGVGRGRGDARSALARPLHATAAGDEPGFGAACSRSLSGWASRPSSAARRVAQRPGAARQGVAVGDARVARRRRRRRRRAARRCGARRRGRAARPAAPLPRWPRCRRRGRGAWPRRRSRRRSRRRAARDGEGRCARLSALLQFAQSERLGLAPVVAQLDVAQRPGAARQALLRATLALRAGVDGVDDAPLAAAARAAAAAPLDLSAAAADADRAAGGAGVGRARGDAWRRCARRAARWRRPTSPASRLCSGSRGLSG